MSENRSDLAVGLAIIALDVFVIWAPTVHGRDTAAA